jgi:hypothetical protein
MKKLHSQLFKLTTSIASMLLLAAAMCLPAWAASSSSKTAIDSVDISIEYDTFYDDDLQDEGDVTVTILTDGVHLDDKTITNLPSNRWHEGTHPILKLTLYADSGYYFSTYAAKKDNINIIGYGDCTASSRSDSNSCLTVKIKLEEVEEGDDDDDDDDDDDWYWPYYSSNTPGGYSGPGGSSQTSSTTGAWLKDNTGWWYCYPNKTYPRNTWLNLNGNWYYFGDNGYLYMNKWVLWNNLWYYCGSNGVMLRDTYTPDGYWVDSNGVWYPSQGSGNYGSTTYSSYYYGPGATK